jgi:hypothetical protein
MLLASLLLNDSVHAVTNVPAVAGVPAISAVPALAGLSGYFGPQSTVLTLLHILYRVQSSVWRLPNY